MKLIVKFFKESGGLSHREELKIPEWEQFEVHDTDAIIEYIEGNFHHTRPYTFEASEYSNGNFYYNCRLVL